MSFYLVISLPRVQSLAFLNLKRHDLTLLVNSYKNSYSLKNGEIYSVVDIVYCIFTI